MEKPALLRAEIAKHMPELAENPDKLSMFITEGKVMANKATLSHETSFLLSILITDFVGDLDVLNAVIINWLQANQPNTLGPGATDPKAYTFEADILAAGSADVLVELRLSERTRALVNERGHVKIDHPTEPQHERDLMGVLGRP